MIAIALPCIVWNDLSRNWTNEGSSYGVGDRYGQCATHSTMSDRRLLGTSTHNRLGGLSEDTLLVGIGIMHVGYRDRAGDLEPSYGRSWNPIVLYQLKHSITCLVI